MHKFLNSSVFPYALAAVVVVVVLLLVSLKCALDPSIVLAMGDVDSWLRLSIISDLYHGTGWYDHTIERMNPPLGMVTPWTRLVDVLMLMLTAPFLPLMPFEDALMTARLFFNPLLLLMAACLLYGTARRAAAPVAYSMWLILPMLLLSPSVADYFIIGGVDHHSLLCVLSLALWYCLTWFHDDPENAKPLWVAGACAGLGLWVSVEFMLPACAFLGGLLWMWCWQGKALWLKGFLKAVLALLGMIILALVVEKPASERWNLEYDTISIVYVLSFSYLLGAYALLWRLSERGISTRMRWLGAVVAGSVALAATLYAFPEITQGPMAGLSPEVHERFLDKVAEMQPLWRLGADYILAFGCYFFLTCLLLVKGRHRVPQSPYFWLLFVLSSGLFLLSLTARRLAYYSIPLSAFVLLVTLAHRQQKTRPLAMLVLGMLPFLTLLLSDIMFGNTRDPLRYEQCRSSLSPLVETGEIKRLLGNQPLLIGAHGNLGTYLLFRTPHQILSSNYHRDGEGLIELRTLLEWKDEEAGKELLRRRKVDALIVCEKPGNSDKLPQYLHQTAPAWAEELYAHTDKDKETTLRIYRVLRDRL